MTATSAAKQAELDTMLALRQAMDSHRQGRFADAERGYAAALQCDPDCFEALHFLSVVHLQQKRLPEALALVARALKARPCA